MYLMNSTKDILPDDPELLKEIIVGLQNEFEKKQNEYKSLDEKIKLLDGKYSSLEKNYISLDEKYNYLNEKYNTIKRLFFGSKSEKLSPEDEHQMRLFNEAEEGLDSSSDSVDESAEEETNKIAVKGHTRKKSGRRPLPDYLPREEIVHDLTEEEKICPCCGNERPQIGEETTEELDIIPPKILVNKHIRKKYGPCKCDDFFGEEIPEIKTAAMPPRLIVQGIASSGLVAYAVTAKFCDALPFYRQSKIFERLDIELSRATLCNWAMLAAEKCKVLVDIMIEEIRGGPVIRMDETSLQVLNEPGRPAESKSYMWVAMGYALCEKPLVIYQYHPTRSGEVPKKILQDYKGFLQTDGYDGYNQIEKTNEIAHVGCFAHARREFEKAMKQSKKSKIAYKGLNYIRRIYIIENDLRGKKYEPDVFIEKRKAAVMPVLDEFHNWLLEQQVNILPEGYTGKAVSYALNQWHKLVRYVDHHLLTPDNNLVENAIRPFVMGRKNWLFSNTPRGAEASAVLFSLIESAKANKLEPYRYLRFIFDRVPSAKSRDELRSLLPDKVTHDMIKLD